MIGTVIYGEAESTVFYAPRKPLIILFYKKTVPIISGNFVMKSRFACADSISVRKHTKMTSRFVSVTFFSGQNLENSTNTVLKNRDRALSNGPTASSV